MLWKNGCFFLIKTDIVKLYDVSRTPNNLYMFLEYCMDGDLKEYLKKKKGGMLSEPESIKFF